MALAGNQAVTVVAQVVSQEAQLTSGLDVSSLEGVPAIAAKTLISDILSGLKSRS